MILRNFLFLDTAMMTDYLATLEGYTIEGTIEETEISKKSKAGKVSAKIVGAELDSETSTETRRRFATTNSARLQRLYDLLQEQHVIQPLDAFDEHIWNQLQRGELLEVQAIIGLPEWFTMTQIVEDVSPFLDIMAAIDEDAFADPDTRTAFEGMRALAKLTEKKPVPLLFEPASTPGFAFVANLSRSYLRCPLADLEGEATVLGKIQRILRTGQTKRVFGILPDIQSSLPKVGRQQRPTPGQKTPQVAETITGPGIVLTPLAVYR